MAKKKEKIILEKEYSREKTLAYTMMWDVSERKGYKDFLGYDLKNSLFVYDPKIKKTAIWHNPKASEHIASLVFAKTKNNKNFVKSITKRLDDNWKIFFSYLAKKKKIKTAAEFANYYQGIISWWSAMNTVYPLIENPDVFKEAGKIFFKYRESTQEYMDVMDQVIREFCQKVLGKRLEDLAGFLSFEEALDLAGGRMKKDEIKAIVGRKKGFSIYRNKIYPAYLLSSILKKNGFILNEANRKKYQEIKGTSAFRGIARGIVRIVVTKQEIGNFKKGEILVAEMTSPGYVPIMKIAAAIITDEGGITCHAAIIAREMKKPCVIGTKIATKVLRDGDFVEVDADKGIVRMIE
jgi:phosphoenolpyruvate synthase/pyruvate phosphate dikinase